MEQLVLDTAGEDVTAMMRCEAFCNAWLMVQQTLMNVLHNIRQLLTVCYRKPSGLNALYTLSAGMTEDVPILNRLPSRESEALLLQAWQQLDQRHRFGIIPRVCSSWYHLSLPTFTSLEVTLRSKDAMQQLGMWLRHHGSTLRRFSLEYRVNGLWGDLCGAVQSCSCLQELQLIGGRGVDLQQLKQLTSVRFLQSDRDIIQQFLMSLPLQLRSLDLYKEHYQTWLGYEESIIHGIFSRLPNLTRLDVRSTCIPFSFLASCPNLPPLQELKAELPWGMADSEWAALAKLPCSCLDVKVSTYDTFSESSLETTLTWCTSQRGKECLGKLTGMSWHCDTYHLGASPYGLWPRAVLSCVATAATNLKDLTLKGLGIMDVMDINLLSGLTQLRSLSFSYDGPPDADVVSPLAALPNLQQLTVAGLSAVQADAVRAAAGASGQLPSLTKLQLS